LPNIYLRQGDASPQNVILRDPTSFGSGSTMVASAGSFALTGEPVVFIITEVVSYGAFVLTGENAPLSVTDVVGYGSFVLTGEPITFGITEVVGAGTFALTGEPAPLGITEIVGAGSFALTGISIPDTYTLVAGYGSFVLTGEPATLGGGSVTMIASTGGFHLFGENAPLVWSGAPATLVSTTIVPYVPKSYPQLGDQNRFITDQHYSISQSIASLIAFAKNIDARAAAHGI
jgi:hypothetical protein